MVHIVGEMGRGSVGTILIAAEGGGGGACEVGEADGGFNQSSVTEY
jgi:hypothetical protein